MAKATLTFEKREQAELFALKWARKTKRGHIVGDGFTNVYVTVFHVTEDEKDWINQYVNELNSEILTKNK